MRSSTSSGGSLRAAPAEISPNESPAVDARRRRFVFALGAGGAGATIASAGAAAAVSEAAAAPAADDAAYRVTDHVRDYYRSTKI